MFKLFSDIILISIQYKKDKSKKAPREGYEIYFTQFAELYPK